MYAINTCWLRSETCTHSANVWNLLILFFTPPFARSRNIYCIHRSRVLATEMKVMVTKQAASFAMKEIWLFCLDLTFTETGSCSPTQKWLCDINRKWIVDTINEKLIYNYVFRLIYRIFFIVHFLKIAKSVYIFKKTNKKKNKEELPEFSL